MLDKYIRRSRQTQRPQTKQQRQRAYVTSGVSIPLVTYVQAVRKKKKKEDDKPQEQGLCWREREWVGKKKEKEILLHKEQVWSLQRGWRRTCSVASAGCRWFPLYHNSGRSLDTKKSKPGNKRWRKESTPLLKGLAQKSLWKAKETGPTFLLLVQDGVWARRAHVHGHERAEIMWQKVLQQTRCHMCTV